jgi:hypothetical protein
MDMLKHALVFGCPENQVSEVSPKILPSRNSPNIYDIYRTDSFAGCQDEWFGLSRLV